MKTTAIISYDSFIASLNAEAPPAGLSPALTALWFDSKNDWNEAHELVQDEETASSAECAVHGYLHRKEGDSGNAAYWYRRAGCGFPKTSLEVEWHDLVRSMCGP